MQNHSDQTAILVFSATLITRNDDGKIVLPAQLITQFPDVIIGLFAVVIFVMFDVVSSAKMM